MSRKSLAWRHLLWVALSILIFDGGSVSAETVRGRVIDLDRVPLTGVNVAILGTEHGAITDDCIRPSPDVFGRSTR